MQVRSSSATLGRMRPDTPLGGLQNRVNQGLVDLETGEGFSGLIAFDDNGDGVADGFTWIVTPDGEIPLQAQWRGSVCHDVINFETAVTTCAAG